MTNLDDPNDTIGKDLYKKIITESVWRENEIDAAQSNSSCKLDIWTIEVSFIIYKGVVMW